MSENIQEFYTAHEVAALLRVSKPAVYKWISEGKIDVVRVSTTLRIRRSAVEKFIERSTERATYYDQHADTGRPFEGTPGVAS